MLWLKLALTILAFGACRNVQAQLWENEITVGGAAEDISYAMLQLKDQGYLLVGRLEDPSSNPGGDGDKDVAVYRTDVDGRVIWGTKIDPNFSKTERGLDVVTDADGNIYIAGELDYFTNPKFDIYVVKLSARGGLIWEKVIGNTDTNEKANAIEITSDGHLIIAGSKESDSNTGNGGLDAYAAKLTLDGDIVWEQTLGYTLDDIAFDILEQDNAYAFTGKSRHPQTESYDIFLAELNKDDGSLQGSFHLINTEDTEEEAKSFLWDDIDNTYVIAGKQDIDGASSDMIWTKVRIADVTSGPDTLEFLWGDEYSVYNGDADLGDGAEKIIKTTEDEFVLVGFEEITAAKIGFTILGLNNSGTSVAWDTTFFDPIQNPLESKNYFVSDLVERPNQEGFAITGTRSDIGASINNIFLYRTGPQGITYSNTISGTVYNDLNADCGYDNGETLLKNWIVQATRDDGYQYISSTDIEGNFQMVVPSGNYEVTLLEKNTSWDLGVCTSSYSIEFTDDNQGFTLDFGLAPNLNCEFPYLEINSSTIGIDCNEGEVVYEVLLTNYGASTSIETTVEVLLDEKYEYISSSIDGTVNGSQLLFDIGELTTNFDSKFTITLATDCSDVLDLQAYELKASIVGAELCDPDGDYDFEAYSVETNCIGEGLAEITIKNNGPSIAELSNYIIIEDLVITRVQPDDGPITINPGGEIKEIINLLDPASTARVVLPQTSNYPGKSIATDFVEGCSDDGVFNTGLVLNFLEDDAEGFVAIDVQENKALPTGNYMEVIPRGLPSNNAISSESALKYRIYFENETADTAYTMTIRDTLPEQTILIQEGNSSHPYEFDVYENNVARFTYNDSPFAPGEKGYVEFKLFVEQDATEGCEPIENNALIIFENQVPIQTNTVKNELCGSYAEFVEIVDTPLAPNVPELDMSIYPNPFQTECTIELKGLDIYFWSMEIYTISGQLIETHNSSSETLTLNRAGLDNGIYIVKVLADNQVVKTAKLVVH